MNPTPEICTPTQRLGSWLRRHVPLLLALLFFGIYLAGPTLLSHLTFWVHDAPAISPDQQNLDGAQVVAAEQAGGWKQAGAVVSIFGAAVLYFCAGIVLVWFIMSYITPGLPKWAKKHFTAGFDEADITTNTLSSSWQYVIYLAVWLSLLFFFGICLFSASYSQ